MKTIILCLFTAVMLFGATVANALDDDYWVKTDFPDTEVKLMFQESPDMIYALASNNEIYRFSNPEWEKTQIILNTNVTSLGSYGYFEMLAGTDRGLYAIDIFDLTIAKIDYFSQMKIVSIASDMFDSYVITDRKLYYYSSLYEEWIECKLPGGNKTLKTITIGNHSVLGITSSGELFVSEDNCETWAKAADNPDGQVFTTAAFSNEGNSFYVGTDKGLFVYKTELTEVEDFDGGHVSCISELSFSFPGETDSKKNKIQFNSFIEDRVVVGTTNNGVYGIDSYNKATQKNDSLGDLRITAVAYTSDETVIAGTKGKGIYMTDILSSVAPLDLTPYALKISPNPAKSHASITFRNPEYAQIEIAIYDLFGRKVADVHSGNLAKGDYNFITDLSGLAAGSYFLRFGVGYKIGSLNLIVE